MSEDSDSVGVEPPTGRPVGKSQTAYAWIRTRIGRRDFPPGYRLRLGAIAAELGFSVVPVREAIRRLEAEGLVTVERNVGARVAHVDWTEYLFTMQTLSVVEGAATALAAPHLSRMQIASARATNQNMIDLLEDFDPSEFATLNHRFHALLFESCPNPHILGLVHRGWDRLSGLRETSFAFVPERATDSVREHARILDLIEESAPTTEIESVARDHRWATAAAFLEREASARWPDPAI